jgi:hypothetical protein
MLRSSAREFVDGVGLVDWGPKDQAPPGFLEATKAALALVKETDPRRYAIIVSELRYIVNKEVPGFHPMRGGCTYDKRHRAIELEFNEFQLDKGNEHYGWYLAYYASALVHEATHARLESLCFPYTRATRKRIERICFNEQRRFACRIKRNAHDFTTLVEPFDETQYQYAWQAGFVAKLRDWLRRKREQRKKAI